jgi:predicted secreted protein
MLASLTLAVLGGVAAEGVAKTCGNLTVGKKSSGQTVTLHRCERLTIRLNEAFDGGYQWKATRRPAPSILKLLSDRAISNAPKGAVGGTDTRVFVYRAVGKGRTSLKLTESRPFVPHSQIAKFTLIVRVR